MAMISRSAFKAIKYLSLSLNQYVRRRFQVEILRLYQVRL